MEEQRRQTDHRVIRLEEWRTGVESRLKVLEHALFGNGQPGALDKIRTGDEEGRETRRMVNTMIAKQQKIEDRAERDEMARQQEMRRFLWGVTLLIVATAVNIVVNLFK
jgi:hypothetical protein